MKDTVWVDALPEAAFLFDGDGMFECANAEGRQFLETVLPSKARPDRYEYFLSVLRGAGFDMERPYLELDGARYTPRKSIFESGILLRLMPVPHDKHMTRLSQSLEIMPWALLTVENGPRPVVLFANNRVAEFVGAGFGKVAGMPAAEIFAAFDFEKQAIAALNTTKTFYLDHETRRDGRVCWYRFHFIPYGTNCLVVIDDMTERKMMEAQYFQSQRLETLGQLAGGVAHDFNNILSIIDGYARMSRKAVKDMPDAVDYLQRISQAVERGSALTGQLLSFGRQKRKDTVVADLGTLVKDQMPLLRTLIDASVEVEADIEDGVFVDVYPEHVCQILMNLFINARDAMPKGGTVRLHCGKGEGDCAILSVRDTGCGMEKSLQERIFDPFFTTKEAGKGTGLGLSMVYDLVTEMRGTIAVESAPGDGAAFIITLPLSRREKDFHELEEEEDDFLLKGYTALVAEDEPDLLRVVSGMMSEMGITVLTAQNGTEAMSVQEEYKGRIDFLVTDVVMPEISGVALAEQFRESRPDSRVLFMTGYPTGRDMSRFPLPEGALYFSKPVNFRKLSSLVKGMAGEQDNVMENTWRYLGRQWKDL